MSVPFIDAAFQRLSHELSVLGRDLARASVLEIPNDTRRDEAARLKAMVYVLLAAALERFVKDTLWGVFDEIGKRAVAAKNLHPGLCAMLVARRVQSVSDSSGLKQFERAAELFVQIGGQEVLTSEQALLPLDGKTIRAVHFETIWKVLCLQGPAVHGFHIGRLALEALAEGRNLVAHGDETAIEFGRKQVAGDVQKMLERVEMQCTHFLLTVTQYVDARQYLR